MLSRLHNIKSSDKFIKTIKPQHTNEQKAQLRKEKIPPLTKTYGKMFALTNAQKYKAI